MQLLAALEAGCKVKSGQADINASILDVYLTTLTIVLERIEHAHKRYSTSAYSLRYCTHNIRIFYAKNAKLISFIK